MLFASNYRPRAFNMGNHLNVFLFNKFLLIDWHVVGLCLTAKFLIQYLVIEKKDNPQNDARNAWAHHKGEGGGNGHLHRAETSQPDVTALNGEKMRREFVARSVVPPHVRGHKLNRYFRPTKKGASDKEAVAEVNLTDAGVTNNFLRRAFHQNGPIMNNVGAFYHFQCFTHIVVRN